jgi:hypothetical protein
MWRKPWKDMSKILKEFLKQLPKWRLSWKHIKLNEEGIAEMKEVLGLDSEEELGGKAAPLELVAEDE